MILDLLDYLHRVIWHRIKVKDNKYGFKQPFIRRSGKKKNWVKGDGNMGAIKEIIFEDGHGWGDYLPALEVQNKYFESMTCWFWSTVKAVRTILKKKYNDETDYAERYGSVLGNGGPGGGNPQTGCEVIRNYGLVKQEVLPWESWMNSFWQFSSPRPMPQSIIDEGKKWLDKYTFNHDWVVYPGGALSKIKNKLAGISANDLIDVNIENMKDALKSSPLCAGVYAWQFRNGLAYSTGVTMNHWVMIYDFVEGEYWMAYDNYQNCWIKLEWRYFFQLVKRFNVNKKATPSDDAKFIIDTMGDTDVKGTDSPAIYRIFAGMKAPYKTSEDRRRVYEDFYKTPVPPFRVVAQSAIDLVPYYGGDPNNVITYDGVKNSEIFSKIN